MQAGSGIKGLCAGSKLDEWHISCFRIDDRHDPATVLGFKGIPGNAPGQFQQDVRNGVLPAAGASAKVME